MAARLAVNLLKMAPLPFRSTQREIQKELSPYHHVFRRTRKGAPTSLGRHARDPYLKRLEGFAKPQIRRKRRASPLFVRQIGRTGGKA
jgi:hypothetical protein